MISFTVYGNPVAQGRPRAFIPKGSKRNYPIVTDPQNAREWKQMVKLQAIAHKPDGLIEEAVHLVLTFYLLRPKSLPKKVVHHIKKPDLDNLVKAIKDALTKVIYRSDSQVIREVVEKNYCQGTEQPRVEIMVGQV